MSEQFVLRWHYQETTLLKNLSTFFDSDILTDVTIFVESHHVKAHRLVLAMCSVYFFQLFQEMSDTKHPVIILHNVALGDLKALLSFVYRGQCVVTKEQLPGLLSLAKTLKIQGLCDMKVPERNEVLSEKRTEAEPETNTPPESEIEGTESTSPELRTCIKDTLLVPLKNANKNSLDEEDDVSSSSLRKLPKDLSETCKCFICGKYLSNQYNLRVHMETHEEAYHACQSCPHVSRSRDALRKHVSYRHPEEYHTRKRKKLQ